MLMIDAFILMYKMSPAAVVFVLTTVVNMIKDILHPHRRLQ